MKATKGFAPGKAAPSFLQFPARCGSEVRVHFRLRQVLKGRDSNLFQIVDDLQFELLILCYRLRRLVCPAQRTAVECVNGAFVELRCRPLCLDVAEPGESRISARLIAFPVRFAVSDQYKFEREVFARTRFTLFLCHDDQTTRECSLRMTHHSC